MRFPIDREALRPFGGLPASAGKRGRGIEPDLAAGVPADGNRVAGARVARVRTELLDVGARREDGGEKHRDPEVSHWRIQHSCEFEWTRRIRRIF